MKGKIAIKSEAVAQNAPVKEEKRRRITVGRLDVNKPVEKSDSSKSSGGNSPIFDVPQPLIRGPKEKCDGLKKKEENHTEAEDDAEKEKNSSVSFSFKKIGCEQTCGPQWQALSKNNKIDVIHLNSRQVLF